MARAQSIATTDSDGILRDMQCDLPRVLQCASGSDTTAAIATATLFSEAATRPELRAALVVHGGSRLLAALAESHDPYVQLLAVYAMAHLTAEERNLGILAQEGCAGVLVSLIEPTRDEVLLQAATVAVTNLARSPMGRRALTRAGAASRLDGLRAHASGAVKTEAAAALAALLTVVVPERDKPQHEAQRQPGTADSPRRSAWTRNAVDMYGASCEAGPRNTPLRCQPLQTPRAPLVIADAATCCSPRRPASSVAVAVAHDAHASRPPSGLSVPRRSGAPARAATAAVAPAAGGAQLDSASTSCSPGLDGALGHRALSGFVVLRPASSVAVAVRTGSVVGRVPLRHVAASEG